MKHKCLYCYQELNHEIYFHEACSLAFFGSKTPPKLEYSLDDMTILAKQVVKRSVSVPGVQPKLSMSIENDMKDSRLTIVGTLGGNYIFKPPSKDYPEMPQNEHLTMRLAELFGITTVQSTLMPLVSGELAYITKRIDRTDDNQKIHMLDMFQITEAYDKYKSSMEKIGRALTTYSANTLLDKIFFFEITVFSFLTGNNDMHLKNFSMIYSNSGWILSSAYDLLNVSIVNPKDKEEMALTIGGKKSKLKRQDFEDLAIGLGLNGKQIEGVFKRFKRHQKVAVKWIDNSFLSNDMKTNYRSLLQERYNRLY